MSIYICEVRSTQKGGVESQTKSTDEPNPRFSLKMGTVKWVRMLEDAFAGIIAYEDLAIIC